MKAITKGEKTRADIVNCAKQLFYERGYAGTSFTDIVDTSGLYRGNIYHYFKAKDEILAAVIGQHLADFSALLAEWDKEISDPKQRLLAFAHMIVGRQDELLAFGCPIGTLNTELGKGRRDLQQAARSLFDLFRDWLAGGLAELGHTDQARSLALHLLGRAQGIAVITHVYQDASLLQNEITQLEAWIATL